jgi:hypothetical protein
MQSNVITAISARICRSTLLALALTGGYGCAAGAPPAEQLVDDSAQTDAEIAVAEEALTRGRVGGNRLGFTCTNGVCECDKAVENDCEDMSGVCSDDTVDDLITCIDGWLTTHCVCNLARVAPPKVRFAAEVGTFNNALLAR